MPFNVRKKKEPWSPQRIVVPDFPRIIVVFTEQQSAQRDRLRLIDELYRHALEREPSNTNHLQHYASFLATWRLNFVGAAEVFFKALRQDPRNLNLLRLVASFLFQYGYNHQNELFLFYTEALFKEIFALNSSNIDCLLLYAHYLHVVKKDFTGTEKILNFVHEIIRQQKTSLNALTDSLLCPREKDKNIFPHVSEDAPGNLKSLPQDKPLHEASASDQTPDASSKDDRDRVQTTISHGEAEIGKPPTVSLLSRDGSAEKQAYAVTVPFPSSPDLNPRGNKRGGKLSDREADMRKDDELAHDGRASKEQDEASLTTHETGERTSAFELKSKTSSPIRLLRHSTIKTAASGVHSVTTPMSESLKPTWCGLTPPPPQKI